MENAVRRVHCRETILYGDPISFICSLNSNVRMGEYSSRVRVFVYAYSVYLRASRILIRALSSGSRINIASLGAILRLHFISSKELRSSATPYDN